MKFRVRGRDFEVTREAIVEFMGRSEPKRVRKYYVEHEGKRFPVKQVVEGVIGIDARSFTTTDALRILKALGFEVKRRE